MNHEQPCLGALAVRLGSVDAVVIRGPEAEEDAELVIIIIIIMIIMIIIIIIMIIVIIIIIKQNTIIAS